VTEEKTQQEPEHHLHYTKRDAETQTALGIFISVISIPVVIGTFWAQTTRAMAVNAIAGCVLLAIGITLVVWGRKTIKKIE
jgi:hypothetical protein